MLKVSFKDENIIVRTFNDKATVVTMTGRVDLPDFWDNIPYSISSWIYDYSAIDVDGSWKQLIIISKGKSVCADDDTFNEEVGYMIAESRAMIKIYKFMHTLCEKLMKYYYDIMYGNAEFDVIRESHTEAPKDCLYLVCQKYRELWIKESRHLGKLLEEA